MPAADLMRQPAATDRRHLWAAVALLLIGGVSHVVYLLFDCPLDLSGDEAHYWEWSRRLDLSYYSKGPLVAYIIAGGRWLLADLSQRLLGNEVLAVRGPAILLSMLTGFGIFVLTAQTLHRPRLGLATVALTFTVPILAVGAILMTIDAPLACCYVWALVACHRGLRGGAIGWWLLAGLLIALGILAKYTMVLIFPPVGLAMLTERSYRPNLRRPGPYLATAVGFAGLLPIVIWNAQHDWVSFRHVAGQAGVAEESRFEIGGVFELIGGQLAVVGPVWFVALLIAVIKLWRDPLPRAQEHHTPAALKLLLYATLTPWIVFLVFSPVTKIQPNWPVLALVTGLPLLVLWLSRLLHDARAATRRVGKLLIAAGIALGGAAVLVVHYSELVFPALALVAPRESALNLTPMAKLDPSARLRGWEELGRAVGRHCAALHERGGDPFIITDDYQVASQIAFYAPGHPPVYCLQAALGQRQSQYDIWHNPIDNPADFVGRPCVYVGTRKPALFGDDERPAVLRGARLVETVEPRVQGHRMNIWPIFVCESFAGVPAEMRAEATGRF